MHGRKECVVGGMRGRGGVHDRGHVWQGGVHSRGAMHGGMHGGGACMVGGGSCMAGGHAWQEQWQLQRAARILLECILVL